MRLFIAINLNEKTKAALLELRDELRSQSECGSFTTPDNLHLTLAFLGECDARQTGAAKASMDAVCFEQFGMYIERIGRFGGGGGGGAQSARNPAKPQVNSQASDVNERVQSAEALWWAGIKEDKKLLDLHRDINSKLRDARFVLDSRRFSPHITLGRRVVTDAAPRRIEPFGEIVSRIDLMKSERIGGRLTYTPIYTKTAKSV